MISTENATGTVEQIGERDHSQTSEYRIFGPPGCGKTTNMTRQIQRAAKRYGADSVLVTSFSRAAAAELTGRGLDIPRNRIGTLHSHCFHALGAPQIAECNVDEWNRRNDDLTITPKSKSEPLDERIPADDKEEETTDKNGDEMLGRLSRYRGMMLDRATWSLDLLRFEKKWTEYKRANGLYDFCDLIEICLHDVAVAPGNPSVIFADEAQDLNRMQLTLIRKWGERAQYFIMAGDDDQTIYAFTGATPDAFLDPDIPDDHKIILKQSYRVPIAVHDFAEKLIRRVKRRQPKEYLPRPADGHCERLDKHGYKRIEFTVLPSLLSHLAAGHTVMLLTTCSYMLQPIIAVLRKQGIPFHNPYRRSNGFWNPIRQNLRGSMVNRLTSLLRGHDSMGDDIRPWTFNDVILWAEVLKAKGVLRQGAKASLLSRGSDQPITGQGLEEIFEPAALDAILEAYEGDHKLIVGWWKEHLTAESKARADFAVEIAKQRGPAALTREPQVVVGTIHSVKGGERDVVYLFPDISREADRTGARDPLVRLFYVGATRAKERLYLCHQDSARFLDL